ncbi:MFS transporter [Oerskovia sp. M15]
MLALTAVLALALARYGTTTWLLLASSLALGSVTAFCLPATGSMPRRMVPDDQLTRALALRQGLSQVVLMTAAPLGGLLVGGVGVPAIAWAATVTFGVSLCVLVAIPELSGPASDKVPTLDRAPAARPGRRLPRRRQDPRTARGAPPCRCGRCPDPARPVTPRAAARPGIELGRGWTGAVAGAVGSGSSLRRSSRPDVGRPHPGPRLPQPGSP